MYRSGRNEADSKSVDGSNRPGVRIPPSPPLACSGSPLQAFFVYTSQPRPAVDFFAYKKVSVQTYLYGFVWACIAFRVDSDRQICYNNVVLLEIQRIESLFRKKTLLQLVLLNLGNQTVSMHIWQAAPTN